MVFDEKQVFEMGFEMVFERPDKFSNLLNESIVHCLC